MRTSMITPLAALALALPNAVMALNIPGGLSARDDGGKLYNGDKPSAADVKTGLKDTWLTTAMYLVAKCNPAWIQSRIEITDGDAGSAKKAKFKIKPPQKDETTKEVEYSTVSGLSDSDAAGEAWWPGGFDVAVSSESPVDTLQAGVVNWGTAPHIAIGLELVTGMAAGFDQTPDSNALWDTIQKANDSPVGLSTIYGDTKELSHGTDYGVTTFDVEAKTVTLWNSNTAKTELHKFDNIASDVAATYHLKDFAGF
ncbi:hypothetical protein IAT38_004931 [Cryptococcus sp. DSM 104549]